MIKLSFYLANSVVTIVSVRMIEYNNFLIFVSYYRNVLMVVKILEKNSVLSLTNTDSEDLSTNGCHTKEYMMVKT